MGRILDNYRGEHLPDEALYINNLLYLFNQFNNFSI